MHYCTGPSTLQFPAELRELEGFFPPLPTKHGGIDPIKFLLRQEGIKMNLEKEGVETLFPLNCSVVFVENQVTPIRMGLFLASILIYKIESCLGYCSFRESLEGR